MRVVTPETIDDTVITATNATNDFSDWASGSAPYAEGAEVVHKNQAWESLSSNSDEPDVGAASDPPTWLRLGWSNQYRMFREGQDSKTTATGDIDVTLDFSPSITTLAALGVTGNTVQLIVTDSVEGIVYDETIDLYQPSATGWWEFYFLPYEVSQVAIFEGIPPYPGAEYNLIVTANNPTDPVSVGRVVAGTARTLGVTNYGTSIQLQDYSTKERDGFGNLVLVPRRAVNLVDYEVTVQSAQVDYVIRTLKSVLSTPTLVIGETNYGSTITFGVLQDVTQGIDFPSVSDLTVRVEEF